MQLIVFASAVHPAFGNLPLARLGNEQAIIVSTDQPPHKSKSATSRESATRKRNTALLYVDGLCSRRLLTLYHLIDTALSVRVQ